MPSPEAIFHKHADRRVGLAGLDLRQRCPAHPGELGQLVERHVPSLALLAQVLRHPAGQLGGAELVSGRNGGALDARLSLVAMVLGRPYMMGPRRRSHPGHRATRRIGAGVWPVRSVRQPSRERTAARARLRPAKENDHGPSHRKHRPGLRAGLVRGEDQVPRLPRRQMGRAVFAPRRLHPRLHHRARPSGPAEERVRQAQREGDRAVGRSGRLPPGWIGDIEETQSASSTTRSSPTPTGR